jgi:hypothetical protein
VTNSLHFHSCDKLLFQFGLTGRPFISPTLYAANVKFIFFVLKNSEMSFKKSMWVFHMCSEQYAVLTTPSAFGNPCMVPNSGPKVIL